MILEIFKFFIIGFLFSVLLIVLSKIVLNKFLTRDYDYYKEGNIVSAEEICDKQ